MRAGTKAYIKEQQASEEWIRLAKQSQARILQNMGRDCKIMAEPLDNQQLVQGAAMLMIEKLLIDTNSKSNGIMIGFSMKDDPSITRNFRITLTEVSRRQSESRNIVPSKYAGRKNNRSTKKKSGNE